MRRAPRGGATRVLSVAMVLIGIALVVRTVAAGGGAVAQGVLVGALFVLAGAGRLWVESRSAGP
jgi:multisubunit Na+/H+ antiporter MnhB subunit